MNSTHIISQDVFDKIRSRFTNLEMGNEQGDITSDPKEARFFDFDFVVEGNNLGRVSISINETGALKLFYSQGILESTDDFIHQMWYDFLREMRMFAKRRLLRFDTRDITKSNLNKDDFQYLANTGSKDNDMNMNESAKFQGGAMTSKRVLEKAVLIAKHHNPIHDESFGARSRKNNIKALFIENEEGERYKFPFIYIAGAKAMQRHVANGGRPYDELGQHIIKMCENIAQLTAFKRHVGGHDQMNQEVNEIVERSHEKLVSLRRQVESICGQAGYESWCNQAGAMSPVGGDGLELDQATMETYKSKFTVNSFKEDLAQYFPLIHSIMQEAGTVDLENYVSEDEDEHCDVCEKPMEDCECDHTNEGAFANFEAWANRVAEGKLEPDTIMDLKDLLDGGLTLDVDGESAINALQGIGVHDDELENQLRMLADPEQGGDPKNDPKDTILKWLAADDPEAAQELGYKGDGQEDAMNGDDGKHDIEHEISPKAVAEMVFSFYNKNHKEEGVGPFPKGETGVVTHITKELGDRAGKMAEELVNYISNGHHETMEEGKLSEIKKGAKDSNGNSSCWTGYHAAGTKKGKNGGQVRNCVPNESVEEGAPITMTPDSDNGGAVDNFKQQMANNTEIKYQQSIKDMEMDEALEDNTAHQVARYMFDKGVRWDPSKEKHIIGLMDDAMKKMNMSAKSIRYNLSYDEDFIPDVLGYLQHMEGAVDEISAMEGADMDKIPAYVRKQKQQSQQTAQAAIDKKNKDSGAKVWRSPRTNEELTRIAQLAGLAK